MNIKKIAILYGGNTERDVSINSCNAVLQALKELGYDSCAIDPKDEQDLYEQLQIYNPEFVINVLHGGVWEGGLSQKVLVNLNIKHSSVSEHTAKMMMNKADFLSFVKQLDVLTPVGAVLTKQDYMQYSHFPHMIKTLDGGSSIGTEKIKNINEKKEYLSKWLDVQHRVIEEFVIGIEYSVAYLHGECFGGCVIDYQAEFCDYYTKTDPNSTLKHILPSCDFQQACAQAEQIGLKIYNALNEYGLIRIDFMIDTATKQVFVIEANPNPGMTNLSIVPDIAKLKYNMNYNELIQKIIEG